MHFAQRDYRDDEFVVARIIKPAIVHRTWLALTTQRPATLAARTVARAMTREVRTAAWSSRRRLPSPMAGEHAKGIPAQG